MVSIKFHLSTWEAIDRVLWRQWFKRIWIVQEVALAKGVTVYCGGDSIPWTSLESSSQFIAMKRFNFLIGGLQPWTVEPLAKARADAQACVYPPLAAIVAGFRNSQTPNPIDKVYALLGLTNEGRDIVPDYNAKAADVFREFSTKFLRTHGLDYLGHVSNPADQPESELPSWAADLSQSMRENPLVVCDKPGLGSPWRSPFLACGEKRGQVGFSEDGKLLIVQGRVLDVVSHSGPTLMSMLTEEYQALFRSLQGWLPSLIAYVLDHVDEGDIHRHLFRADASCFRIWERMVLGLKRYCTGEDIKTVLQRTMIADDQHLHALIAASGTTLADFYAAFRNIFIMSRSGPAPQQDANWQKAWTYYHACRWSISRKLFTTKQGYVGLGPSSTRYNDRVVLLAGGKTAYMMRKMGKTSTYTYLGEVYLHGSMHGEGFEGHPQVEEIRIM